ncbi:MAG: hypothetical protein ACTS3F_13750 [Phycisphaerales bacterium]
MKRIDQEDTLKSTPPESIRWKRDRHLWRWTIPARYSLAYIIGVCLACLALALGFGWA